MFLDGTIRPSSPYFLVNYRPPDFVLHAGAAHGIASPSPDGTTLLALFELTARPADLRDSSEAIGQAEVVEVLAATSRTEGLWPGGPGRPRDV